MLGRRLLNLEMLENREVPASVQSFDIVPDLPSSSPKHFVGDANGTAYFIASTTAAGAEGIFSSQNGGSPSLLHDLTDAGASSPSNLQYFGGALYFTATSVAKGQELWIASPIEEGSVSVLADIAPAGLSSNPSRIIGDSATGKFYFVASDDASAAPRTYRIWESLGTTATTKPLAAAGGLNVERDSLTLLNGSLYFSAGTANGNAPHQLNLTTGLVTEIRSGVQDVEIEDPQEFVLLAGKVYFTAVRTAPNEADKEKLFSWDGTALTEGPTLRVNPPGEKKHELTAVQLQGKDYIAYAAPRAQGNQTDLALWDGANDSPTIVGNNGAYNPTSLTASDLGLYFIGSLENGVRSINLLTGLQVGGLNERVSDDAVNPIYLVLRQSDQSLWFVSDNPAPDGGKQSLTSLSAAGVVRYIPNGSNTVSGPISLISDHVYFPENMKVWNKYVTRLIDVGEELGIYTDEPNPKVDGKVWLDQDRDGIRSAIEVAVSGAQVSLFDQNGQLVMVTNTIQDGSYSLNNPAMGDYVADVFPGAGYLLSPSNQGSDDLRDSDFDPIDSRLQLQIGYSPIHGVDAGVSSRSISGRVWFDSNGNGVQDSTEAAAAGLTVVARDSSNQVVGTAITGTNGQYAFDNLPIGDYIVLFAPAGNAFTAANQGADDTVDSDFVYDPQTLMGLVSISLGNAGVTHVDAGLVGATLSGTVFLDIDLDGQLDGGLSTAGEPGIAGVTVTLYDMWGDEIASAVTDSSGIYSFDVAAGETYTVGVAGLAGHFFTTFNSNTATPLSRQTANFNFGLMEQINGYPVYIGPGDQVSAEGDLIVLNIANGTDPDGDALTYTIDGTLPAGLSFDGSTIAGSIAFDAAGTYSLILTATDSQGAATSTTLTWSVANTNRTPEYSGPGDQTSAEGESIYLNIATGTDPDGDALTYTVDGTLPPGLSFDGINMILGSIGYDAASSYTVTVTATDALGAATAATFTWNINQTNQAPWFAPLPSYVHAEGDTVSINMAGAFDNDGDALIYSLVGDLPQGLTMDVQGNIAGTITFDAAGNYPITVVATDPHGATGTYSVIWTVLNTNRTPEFTGSGDQTNAEAESIYLNIATGNDPDGDSLTYTIDGTLPDGLSFDGSTIWGSISYSAAGTYSLTLTATDSQGAATSTTLNWNIANTNRAPWFVPINDQYSAEGETVSTGIGHAVDNDGEPLTYSILGNLPPGLTMDSNGNVTGDVGDDSAGSYLITIVATDTYGAYTAYSFMWFVAEANG